MSCKSDDDHELTVKEQIQGRWEMTNLSSSSSIFDLIEFPKYLWIQETHLYSSDKSDFTDLGRSIAYTFDESTKTIAASTYIGEIEGTLNAQVTSIDGSNMTWNATVTAMGITIKATMTFKIL